jgi:hypothetical protein
LGADQALQLPITWRNNSSVCKIEWRPAAYHTVLQILRHPVYAGAYVFGRTTQRTRIVDGRARKTTGHSKPMAVWSVLLRDHDCQSALNFDPGLECAPDHGQNYAAGLTGCRACWSSN